ncbi:MAG: hypothetical protein ACREA0_27530 [bacterium]
MPRSVRQELITRERQKRALALRLRGATYRQIAAQVGYANQGGAHKAVKRALVEVGRDEAVALRKLEMERLHEAFRGVWAKATDGTSPGNTKAIDTALKIMDKMDRLSGL